jgi:two-component system cell cycle sensor histidine kinase/response regulator CckA
MREMGALLERVLGEDVEILWDLAEEACFLRSDTTHIEQILMNLLVNARDAMPQGGRLTIQTRLVELDEGATIRWLGDPEPGRYVVLSVSDTGVGMHEEIQARIFDPFFTTKGPERGTGLGLSTVYALVRRYGGGLWVNSREGEGATFRIALPQAVAHTATREREAALVVPHGRERILVVEDEDEVMATVSAILEGLGYDVTQADRPGKAIEAFLGAASPFDLVISDVIMPEMSGPELVRRLSASRPDLRILLMSGHPERRLRVAPGPTAAHGFLQKPITVSTLAAEVRRVLDEGRVLRRSD